MTHMRRRRRKRLARERPATARLIRPRTAEEFLASSERFQDLWTRVTHAVTKMKSDRLSVSRAAREFELDPRTLTRWGSPALRKHSNGRYFTKASDTLLRVVEVLTEDGRQLVGLRDSHQATLVAEHWNAVHRYLATGDQAALRKFRGEYVIDANGNRLPMLTDPAEIDRFGSAGVLSFETMYARTA